MGYLKKYFEFLYTCEDMKALKWSKFKTQEQQNAKQQQNGKQKDPTWVEMTVIGRDKHSVSRMSSAGAAHTASATTASELKPDPMSRTSSRASEHNSLTSSRNAGMIDVGYGLRAHHGSVSGKEK